ncbi:DNA-binding transcriptional regulator, MarR family [Saccharopolyspora antimicrobica]|uniref:DNA-binding MarR family transcriptional regulator n=1 Tax=Saccharopolyspora antimicrobica TaxID=455193 RepID=A0A1I5JMA0_9PSEU|nr:transcriptional regulator [Saccharopolyspora antimicrobica]RKT84670.1 DNA-binding MarR family transcriptional regulator [Saccharopolyspora antimicrobica]SFO73663.1 DNA-binding transcriptional regulator, MarR family [Saccharopolyspora antimicrobica]
MSRPEHPRHLLDREIHSPVRLSIMALLVTAEQVEFRRVRDTVEVSDSALSKHISTLESVGYVEVRKGNVDGRPRTWLSATPLGRSAYESHLAALDAIIGRP